MPIALSPDESRLSLLGSLPILAVFFACLVLDKRVETARLALIIPLLGATSAFVGFAQILATGNPDLYFYDITNKGFPVGVFANTNHQACFLAMCLPFIAAAYRNIRRAQESSDLMFVKITGLIGLFLIILFGLLAARSVAGYLLLGPALTFCVLIARKRGSSRKRQATLPVLALVTTIASATLIVGSPILGGLGGTSFQSRLKIWETTLDVVRDHWLFGTGLGSFDDVFPLYEKPADLSEYYANHAHNDYLQAVLEFGLPGTILVAAGLALFCLLFFRVWSQRGDNHRHVKRAAAAALVIVLLHSFVDYPLRTSAVACLAATCFALLVMKPGREKNQGSTSTRTSGTQDDRRLVI